MAKTLGNELKTTIQNIVKHVDDEKSAFRHFYRYVYDEWTIELFHNIFRNPDEIVPILMREDGEDYDITFVALNTCNLETLYVLSYKNATNHTDASLKKVIVTNVKDFDHDITQYDKQGQYYEYLSKFWNRPHEHKPIDMDILFSEIEAFTQH